MQHKTLTAMLTTCMVSMISHDDRCFVCGQMAHFGCHYPEAQCCGCDEFGHFVQDCPNKIPLSGTPCHQDRSCLRYQYIYSQRDRSCSTHYGHRHGRHFNQSQSHCCSHHDRSSNFTRHTLFFSSSKCHNLHPTVADGCFIAICAVTHPTSIVTPHPTLAISSPDITHATIPRTGAGLIPATLATLPRKHSQGKSSQPKTFNPQ